MRTADLPFYFPPDHRLDIAEVERLFQTESIKFFYTMPRFHNPLGYSLSERDKQELVRLAEAYDVYLVEDDL